MKINQDLVTKTFQCRNGTSGLYHDPSDVKFIQEVLHRNLGVLVSESEVIDFWHHRSEQWDSSWLSVPHHDDGEILEWFQEFIEFIGVEPQEENEDISLPPPRAGVKVVVKDGEGIPWEIELDPDYHAQLLQDIESQIPEKSEGGSIRYSLEYDPKKIWNMRKLEEEP